jgi:hypothetical protein
MDMDEQIPQLSDQPIRDQGNMPSPSKPRKNTAAATGDSGAAAACKQ